jgi:hypothetical protein
MLLDGCSWVQVDGIFSERSPTFTALVSACPRAHRPRKRVYDAIAFMESGSGFNTK